MLFGGIKDFIRRILNVKVRPLHIAVAPGFKHAITYNKARSNKHPSSCYNVAPVHIFITS